MSHCRRLGLAVQMGDFRYIFHQCVHKTASNCVHCRRQCMACWRQRPCASRRQSCYILSLRRQRAMSHCRRQPYSSRRRSWQGSKRAPAAAHAAPHVQLQHLITDISKSVYPLWLSQCFEHCVRQASSSLFLQRVVLHMRRRPCSCSPASPILYLQYKHSSCNEHRFEFLL